MGHFATGVTIVTSRDHDGEPVGTTANAVTSLSLDPPLILACLAHSSNTLAAVRRHGAFAINILGTQHRDASSAFARSGSGDGWEQVEYRSGQTASPRLIGALATLDCEVEQRYPGGDHEIVVGRVLDIEIGDEGHEPLLFFRGGYLE